MTDGALLWRARRWAAGVAVALAVGGGLLAAAGVDAGQYESAVGAGLVVGAVTVAFTAGTLVWTLRHLPGAEEPPRPDRSTPREPVVQGATFERLAGWRVFPPAIPAADRDQIRDRLRAAAVEAVAASAACDRESARERVRRGDWTGDGAAAAFLGDAPAPRRVAWVARLSEGAAFAVGARAAVTEIDRRIDSDGGREP